MMNRFMKKHFDASVLRASRWLKRKSGGTKLKNHLEMIWKAMECTAVVFTHSHFCHLSQLASGKTITTSRHLIDCEAYTENCEICANT